jgi:fructosamine-3-kinase
VQALSAFEAEAEGLRALATTGAVRVPEVFASGRCGGTSYLVLEFLELSKSRCGGALGTALARLHRVEGRTFGWHRDNTIGLNPQRNGSSGDWVDFWRERRLQPQLALAAGNGFRGSLQELGARVAARLPVLFDDYRPLPSLLHGDLWGGNWGCLEGGAPVVFDPATYYGDRETDLAMTELFGGFPREFYDAYAAEWPLDPGYARRRPLYQLYHVLNHLNLFGGTYLAQAVDLSARLLEL